MNTVSRPRPAADVALRWSSRLFYMAGFVGLGIFGAYILLRGTGATLSNFEQWRTLVSGGPMASASDWVASLGIGMHYFAGSVLVLAWPILFSAKIRARHRLVHRWTGRLYVTAGLLAGIGGMSFMLAHHNGGAPHIAFAIWGAVMMLSAVMAFVHARARRFDLHRAWAIRLFAMVLGSWVFDLEYRAWEDLTGGLGMSTSGGRATGVFDYAILYLFFVPNLLIAEFIIRNQHRKLTKGGPWTWPVLGTLMLTAVVFVYAIAAVSGTSTGKYGKHLLGLVAGWWPGD